MIGRVSACKVGNGVVIRLRQGMPVVLAGAVVGLAAGCSWIQPSNRVLAEHGESTSPSVGTSSSTSAPAAPSQPAWAAALGAGVVVTAPAAAATPGHDSPGGAALGLLEAEASRTLGRTCAYFPPSDQASCQALISLVPAGRSLETVRNIALGYVAVDGNEALVGITGTICGDDAALACASNDNPAAIFLEAKPFRELWAESVAADISTTAHSYSLAPCVKIGRKWYNYYPLSGGKT